MLEQKEIESAAERTGEVGAAAVDVHFVLVEFGQGMGRRVQLGEYTGSARKGEDADARGLGV